MATSTKEWKDPAHRSDAAALKYLPVRSVKPNKHNPRLVFRAEELQDLADSIQDHGVQVPISVFRDGRVYTLIDGERRWRASRQLNLEEIPSIIYPRPSDVQNIVYMFNIHRFRRDWDPLPTAMKLEDLADLMEAAEGLKPTEGELSALTGMSRGAIRRCRLIMEIPQRHRTEILRELEKPERQQRITTDLFIEVQRAVNTLRRYVPDLVSLRTKLRDALIRKYKNETIVNVVHMRLVAKIARASTKGIDERVVKETLIDLAEDRDLGVEEAYSRVAWAYELRSVYTQARSLQSLVSSVRTSQGPLDSETRSLLRSLNTEIRRLLNET